MYATLCKNDTENIYKKREKKTAPNERHSSNYNAMYQSDVIVHSIM